MEDVAVQYEIQWKHAACPCACGCVFNAYCSILSLLDTNEVSQSVQHAEMVDEKLLAWQLAVWHATYLQQPLAVMSSAGYGEDPCCNRHRRLISVMGLRGLYPLSHALPEAA